MTEQLKNLWQLAFGDSMEFIDLFFRTAYSPDRCLYLTEDDEITAALYWLDCGYQEQKQAYIYAVATHPDHRGKGLCRTLMSKAHEVLKEQGYTAALLRPAEPGLRRMYAGMGYRDGTTVSQWESTAAVPVPLRKIDPEEYARLRQQYLPADGAVQEGTSLTYLDSYCGIWAGEDFLLAGAAYEGIFCAMELLGNREASGGILASLGYEKGIFRGPGKEEPFGMVLPLTENAKIPGYLGLVFD